MITNFMNKLADLFEKGFLGNHSVVFKHYAQMFRKWKDFKGRTGLEEFWLLQPAVFVGSLIITLIVSVITILPGLGFSLLTTALYTATRNGAILVIGMIIQYIIGFIGVVINIILIIPSLSLLIRRLHDTGKSAVVLLIMCCCFPIYPILLWWFTIQNSDEGENKYGPKPVNTLASETTSKKAYAKKAAAVIEEDEETFEL